MPNDRADSIEETADPDQHCPSLIITPRGEVLSELPVGETAVLRRVIDTQDASDWYLGQRRTDLLRLQYLVNASRGMLTC